MKKCFPWVIVVVFTLLSLPAQAQAASEWKIQLNGDHSIWETVTLDQGGTQNEYPSWQASRQDNKLVLTRKTTDADAFNKEADRLPLEIKVDDYSLWQNVEVRPVSSHISSGLAQALTAQEQGMRLIIKVSGVIEESSAPQLVEKTTAIWQLNSPQDIYNEGLLAKATVVDGYIVGILLFLLAFVIIAVTFMFKIRRTHKLMEEEYSLENVQLDDGENEEEESDNK